MAMELDLAELKTLCTSPKGGPWNGISSQLRSPSEIADLPLHDRPMRHLRQP
jgi:hypothetical protein